MMLFMGVTPLCVRVAQLRRNHRLGGKNKTQNNLQKRVETQTLYLLILIIVGSLMHHSVELMRPMIRTQANIFVDSETGFVVPFGSLITRHYVYLTALCTCRQPFSLMRGILMFTLSFLDSKENIDCCCILA